MKMNVKFGTDNFDTVKDYTYLGTVLTKMNYNQRLKNRITHANSE
jgi:hypothetical protein